MFNRIRELRIENNWTIYQMSKMLEVSQSTFLKYEKGSVSIRDNVLLKLSNLFNVSIDYILCKSNIKKINSNEDSMLCNYQKLPNNIKIEIMGEIKGILKGLEVGKIKIHTTKVILKKVI
jgi:transcriptional regulator with XRE-family HTH domain